MKKLIIIVLIIAALVAMIAIYLAATTPKASAGVRFPLTDAQRALIAAVPESAESFALIPTAASLDTRMRANPVTGEVVDRWERSHSLPSPWMIGGADLLAWRDATATHYL